MDMLATCEEQVLKMWLRISAGMFSKVGFALAEDAMIWKGRYYGGSCHFSVRLLTRTIVPVRCKKFSS